MSKQDEVHSTELQKIICDGIIAVCAGNNESPQLSQLQHSATAVDITDDFFMECKS